MRACGPSLDLAPSRSWTSSPALSGPRSCSTESMLPSDSTRGPPISTQRGSFFWPSTPMARSGGFRGTSGGRQGSASGACCHAGRCYSRWRKTSSCVARSSHRVCARRQSPHSAWPAIRLLAAYTQGAQEQSRLRYSASSFAGRPPHGKMRGSRRAAFCTTRPPSRAHSRDSGLLPPREGSHFSPGEAVLSQEMRVFV